MSNKSKQKNQQNKTVNQEIPFVETIAIKGLFGKKDINWVLGDVNVLVGQNGSGKSTILRLVYDALRQQLQLESDFHNLDSMDISLKNGYTVAYSKFVWQTKTFRKIAGTLLGKTTVDRMMPTTDDMITLFDKLGSVKVVGVNPFECNFTVDESDNKANRLLQKAHIEYLSTFDMMLLSKKEYDDISGEVFTQLDFELEREIQRLTQYQLALSNLTSKEYTSKANDKDFTAIQDANFSKVNKFAQALNTLFNPNDKQFIISEQGTVEIFDGKGQIKLTKLSSGEKQLLLILLRVVNTSDKPTILLLDEPEISLHLSWQEKLITIIRDINPQCQLIIVSHSPALVINGWMDSYIDLKDISSPAASTK